MITAWLQFALVQLVSLIATVIGWILLIPFCLALKGNRQAIPSPIGATLAGKVRAIDVWPWQPLNWVYGNPEDGVSGRYALVWKNGIQVPYSPPGPQWLAKRISWSAYCWSAWRNSADNLKYVFARKGGPFYRWENAAKTFYFQAGYYPNGYPVLSLGRM